MRDVVPVDENTQKEVNTMAKRTITKWWMWGAVVATVAGMLATVLFFVTLAHAGDLTGGFRQPFVPDSFFWTTISFFVLICIVCCAACSTQLVVQIGAVFNTHRLADKTWFRVLLWGTIIGYLVIFVTLGLQLGFAFSGSIATAFVWPGFVVGVLIEEILMICYLVAGPDGMAIQQPQIATTTESAAPPKTLVPTG
jgi:hypothetical protein